MLRSEQVQNGEAPCLSSFLLKGLRMHRLWLV